MSNGYATWLCYWNVNNTCTYYSPYRMCNYNGLVPSCTGSLIAGSALCTTITSSTTCLASYQKGVHGGPQQCGYTTGVGCYANAPCY